MLKVNLWSTPSAQTRTIDRRMSTTSAWTTTQSQYRGLARDKKEPCAAGMALLDAFPSALSTGSYE